MQQDSGSPGKLSRRGFISLGLGAGAAAALAACAPRSQTPGQTPSPAARQATPKATTPPATGSRRLSDTIDFARHVATRSVDPHSSAAIAGDLPSARPIYDTLLTFDPEGRELIPQLAHEWERIDDLTMEFRLRDDVKFSNGDDFTARTVKANVDRVLNPDNASITGALRGRLGAIAEAEVVDSTTVRIRTSEPDPALANRMTMLMFAPESLIEQGANFDEQPIGTGPYRVTEFVQVSHVFYEAFEGSWRGAPKTPILRIHGIPERAAIAAALRAGDIDIAYHMTGDQIAQLSPEFNTYVLRNDALSLMSLLSSNPALQDRRVRQAINHAVDKQAVLDVINGGFGRLAPGQLIDETVEGFNPDLSAFEYDPDRARRLLDEAGIDTLDLTVETAVTIAPHAEAIAGFLGDVGINLTLAILEPSVFLSKLVAEGPDQDLFHWQAHWWHIRTFHAAAERFSMTSRTPHFENEEFTRLYQESAHEMDDERRVELIQQASAILHEEAGPLFLTFDDIPSAFTTKIESIPTSYDRTVPFEQIEKLA